MKSYYDKSDGFVALLFGGRGFEREVSRLGAVNFLSTAKRISAEPLPIFIDEKGDFFIYSGEISKIGDLSLSFTHDELEPTFPISLCAQRGFYTDGGIIPVSRAIPLLHGDFGEDGRVQGLLEMAGIEVFGEGTVVGAVCSDKAYSKAVARSAGVSVLPWVEFSRESFSLPEAERRIADEFGFPAIVKPCGLGSSVGVRLAKCREDLERCFEEAFAVADRVLAEPALLCKREIECAYYRRDDEEIISSPGEVIVGGIYDYRLKYTSGGATLMPQALLDVAVRGQITDSTRALAHAFGIRKMARFDYFLLPSGKVYFNEVNTFPGMTSGSLYASMLSYAGVSFESLVADALGDAD